MRLDDRQIEVVDDVMAEIYISKSKDDMVYDSWSRIYILDNPKRRF
jgi:hypothetical protein